MEIPNPDITPDDIEPGADLSGAGLAEVNLSDVALSRSTQIEIEFAALTVFMGSDTPDEWDGLARLCHELKAAYSTNGLVGRARKYRVHERRA